MKLPLVAVAFWALFTYAFVLLHRATDSLAITLLALTAYLVLTNEAKRRHWQIVWMRHSLLVRWLRALLSVPAPLVAHARQTIYAVEPHGPACFGYATTFVPSLDGRVRLLASPLYLMVPILRDLYMMGGVVPSTIEHVTACLDRGESLAVIPSGIRGLHVAVVEHSDASVSNIIEVLRCNNGFARCAIAYEALLVPVLSIGEQAAFTKVRLVAEQPFWSTLAWPTLQPVRTVVGAPLDAARYTDPRALADAYYDALCALAAKEGLRVNITKAERSDSSQKHI